VRTGVWEHTTFRTDPIRRLRRTGLAAIVTIYGTRGKAEAMIARIRRMHDRVADLTHQAVVASRNSPTRGDPAAVSILERLDHMKLEVVHLCLEPLDPAFEFLTRANVVTARGEDESSVTRRSIASGFWGCFQTSLQKFKTMTTLFR
jgi:hypothetical protein